MLKILSLTGFLGLLISTNNLSVIAQSTDSSLLEQEGFRFELKGCSNISNADKPLKCEFLVENIQEERRSLFIYADDSRVIDSEGNEIFGLTANLGNKGDSRKASTELINGIPIKGSMTFAKQPVGDIRLVDFKCLSGNYFNVEFPFSR